MAKQYQYPNTIWVPGQRFRSLQGGKESSGTSAGRCPGCGEWHEFEAQMGVFVRLCPKCEAKQIEKSRNIGRRK